MYVARRFVSVPFVCFVFLIEKKKFFLNFIIWNEFSIIVIVGKLQFQFSICFNSELIQLKMYCPQYRSLDSHTVYGKQFFPQHVIDVTRWLPQQDSPSAEMVMLERLFLQAERFSLGEDRRRVRREPGQSPQRGGEPWEHTSHMGGCIAG